MGKYSHLSDSDRNMVAKLQTQIAVSWIPASLVFIFAWVPLSLSTLSSPCFAAHTCIGFEGAGFVIAMIIVFPIVLTLATVAILITVFKTKRIRRLMRGIGDENGFPILPAPNPEAKDSRFSRLQESTKTYLFAGASLFALIVLTILAQFSPPGPDGSALFDSPAFRIGSGWALWLVGLAIGLYRLSKKKSAWGFTLGLGVAGVVQVLPLVPIGIGPGALG